MAQLSDGEIFADGWIPAILAALDAQLQPGDTLALLDFAGSHNYQWLDAAVIGPLLRPRNVSLVLIGDNPVISHDAPMCEHNHGLCQVEDWYDNLVGGGTLQQFDERASAFAAARPGVFFFRQSALWEESADAHFWGNVPGTDVRAYYDRQHQLQSVSRAYLWPHLCSAFSEWGLFDR